MNRMLLFLILFAVAGFSAVAEEGATAPVDPVSAAMSALRAGEFQTAEMRLTEISNPAAKYFVQACIEQAKGDPHRAVQTVAQGIVEYPHDPDWIAKSELLSAVLYLELGMLDAADVTARQAQGFYAGTDIAEKAGALRAEIENLKEGMESK